MQRGKLRQLRERLGITQAEVAKALDMSLRNYYRIENEGQLVSVGDAVTIHKFFNKKAKVKDLDLSKENFYKILS